MAIANPVVDRRDQAYHSLVLGIATLAIGIEVVTTSLALILFCQIERRLLLVAALAFMNVATFGVFVLYLYPIVGSVAAVEVLIVATEAAGLLWITRWLADRPLSPKSAVVVALAGNLFSYLVGLAV